MAQRNESVRLSLQDDFTSGMARAAAATAILNKNLNDLDGSKVSKDLDGAGASAEKAAKKTKEYSLELAVADEKAARLKKSLRDQARAQLDAAEAVDQVGDSIEKLGDSNRKSSAEIDQLSGRLRILADVGVTVGPALIPLTAGVLPALSGALAGLGAAAGGIGVTVLAFKGLGDALTALNNYQLEPTAQNLAALRLEQEKLGPSGAQFLNYIDELGPAMKDLQNTARAGIFPGVEVGINELLTRLPQVKTVIAELSDGIGSIAAGAGASLGGSDFDGFFSYLETDARPTLEAFAKSAGNVALGVANLLTAFAPLSRDFTGGLEDATARFAEFSRGLDNNEGFQNFVSYIREAGPQVLDFAAQTAKAFAAIAQAAAPVGSTVLPILTQIARVFAVIASSPFGPAIFSSIAAFTALNRVGSLASGQLTRLSSSMDKTKVSTDRAAASFTKYAAVGAGAFAALTLGASGIRAIQEATDEALPGVNELVQRLLELKAGQTSDIGAEFDSLADSIARVADKSNVESLTDTLQTPFKGLFGESGSLRQAKAELNDLDEALANITVQGSPEQAAASLKALTDSAGLSSSQIADLTGLLPKYQDAVAGVANQSALAASNTDFLTGTIQNLANGAMAEATRAANELSTSLSVLNGFFDKRDAILNYKDSVDTLAKSLKNGFGRQDLANLNAVGRSILQVAENIKDPGAQRNFLEKARGQLLDMARGAGPEAAAAIRAVVREFDKELDLKVNPDKAEAAIKNVGRLLGVLGNKPSVFHLEADPSDAVKAIRTVGNLLGVLDGKKAKPKVDADTAPAIRDFNQVDTNLDHLNGFTAVTRVTADTGAAQAAIANVRSLLFGLNGTTATTYVRSIRVAERANGGIVNGPGTETSDSIPALLSNNEYVVRAAAVRKYGVGTFDKMNALRLAGGGSVPGGGYSQVGGSGDGDYHQVEAFHQVTNAAQGASGALKVLEGRAKRLEKAQDKQQQKLDGLNATLDSLRSQRDDLAGSTTSSLLHDPFGNGLAGLRAQTEADTNDAQTFLTALQTLRAAGLDANSDLFKQLAASGDVNTATQLTGLSPQALAAQQAAFQQRSALTSQVGSYVGDQSFGAAITAQVKAVNEQVSTNRELQQEIRRLSNQIEKMKDNVREGAKEGTRSGSEEGTRNGQQERTTFTQQRIRTGWNRAR